MEANKKTVSSKILIIFLTIFVVILLGCVVYEHMLLKSEETTVKEGTTEKEETNQEKEEQIKKEESKKEDSEETLHLSEDIEVVTKILLSDGRSISIVDGAIVESNSSPITIENDEFISLGISYTCSGNYHVYALTKQGKLFINHKIVKDFEKLQLVEVPVKEPIVALKNYSKATTTCGSQFMSFFGKSGTLYYPMMECDNNNYLVNKVTLSTNISDANICVPK